MPPARDHAAAPRDLTGIAALLAGAACIGLSPIWVRLSEVGPSATAFWRTALAVPLLWALVPVAPPRAGDTTRAGGTPLLLVAGIAFAGDLTFWHWSIRFTSVANSTLLANLAAIFVTLAAWLLWRERPSRLFTLGLVAALAGVAMLLRASVDFSATALLGDALGIVTALFYAGYLIVVKVARDRGVATLRVMAVATTVTAIALCPLVVAAGEAFLPARIAAG